MKYCVSGRQPLSILSNADEIKMMYKDYERMFDYMDEFPDKTFIVEMPKDMSAGAVDWDLFKAYNERVNMIFGLRELTKEWIETCKDNGIKFYYNVPVFTWYELEGLIALKPCYLYVTDNLYFSLDKIKQKTDIPIRLCANLAFDPYIPREDGITGTWIRPEDVKFYEPYVDTLEFYFTSLSHEATLLHVYKENQNWPGNLNLLLTNLNYNVNNLIIPEELGQLRVRCGRKCVESRNCHLCETSFKFADAIRKRHYADSKSDI